MIDYWIEQATLDPSTNWLSDFQLRLDGLKGTQRFLVTSLSEKGLEFYLYIFQSISEQLAPSTTIELIKHLNKNILADPSLFHSVHSLKIVSKFIRVGIMIDLGNILGIFLMRNRSALGRVCEGLNELKDHIDPSLVIHDIISAQCEEALGASKGYQFPSRPHTLDFLMMKEILEWENFDLTYDYYSVYHLIKNAHQNNRSNDQLNNLFEYIQDRMSEAKS